MSTWFSRLNRWIAAVIGLTGFTSLSSPLAQGQSAGQRVILGVQCSQAYELGMDKQMNLRASMIMVGCGLAEGGQAGPVLPSGPGLLGTLATTSVDVITGTETYPHVTQSESVVWSSDGRTIVVNYNDSSGSRMNYAGLSVSTDGGATFQRLLPSPLATGHGTNFGDPILVYNRALGTWFAGDLVSGSDCGSQGIGLWTSEDGLSWSPGACVHVGNNDDRDSMWVDNHPNSPFYGRMYVSWNDFNTPGQYLFVTYSDDGVNWSPPKQLSFRFIRNVQLTGSPVDGTVFLAAMDEGPSGAGSPRTNLMYRSTDGGTNWTTITMGAPFAPPGQHVNACGRYFWAIPPIWRHMGWGQPGVGPDGVVHYAFAGEGVNPGDIGDIYYTRSLDNGDTWSDPIVLNSDQAGGGSREQWMPSLSVTAGGEVQVYWYDRRNSAGRSYQVWGILSPDNGDTWLTDAPVSDVVIPQPEQPDPNIIACYAGDYNYATAFADTHYATWTDGRIPVSGHPQQDVFFAPAPLGEFVYVNNNNLEAPNNVSAFRVAQDGSLSAVPGASFGTGGLGGCCEEGYGTVVVGRFLYVSNSGTGDITAFTIDPGTGALTAVPSSPYDTGADYGISLAATPDGQFLFAANNCCDPHTTITTFAIHADGSLTRAGIPVVVPNSGPTGIKVTPDGRFLAVVLSNLNAVGTLRIGADGTLTPVGPPQPVSHAGFQTWLDITCDSGTVIIGSLDRLLDVFALDPDTGTLTPVEGSPFNQVTSPEQLLLSADDRFLYTSAFNNSIAQLDVGSFSLDGDFSAGGTSQQIVALATDQSGARLYAAKRRSLGGGGFLSVFGIGADGSLTLAPDSPVTIDTGLPESVAVFPPKSCFSPSAPGSAGVDSSQSRMGLLFRRR